MSANEVIKKTDSVNRNALLSREEVKAQNGSDSQPTSFQVLLKY